MRRQMMLCPLRKTMSPIASTTIRRLCGPLVLKPTGVSEPWTNRLTIGRSNIVSAFGPKSI